MAPTRPMAQPRSIVSVANGIAGAAFALLLGINLYYLRAYVVDIPVHDDWDLFFQFIDGFTLRDLFATHNEHRIVLTKLQSWALFELAGWNMAVFQMMNLVIYLAGVAGLTWFLQRRSGLPPWAVMAFTAFLLTPRLHQNHLWSFQSQFHFAWILAFATVALVFRKRSGLRHAGAAAACAGLAIWSFSAGMLSVAVTILGYAAYRGLRWAREPGERRAIARHAAMFLGPTGLALGAWLLAFNSGETTPLQARFWTFFVNLVANGFGIATPSIALGVVCVAVVVGGGIALFLRDPGGRDPDAWAINVCLVGTVAMLAAVSAGRAQYPFMAKASRFAELAGLLVPLVAAAWSKALVGRSRWRTGAVAALWIACAVGYANDWSFRRYYGPASADSRAGYRCVEAYYFHGGNGICTTIWWNVTLAQELDQSRELDLSFYRKMQAEHVRELPGGGHGPIGRGRDPGKVP